MIHSLPNATSETARSPSASQWLVKRYFYTLPRFRRFAKNCANEAQFKVELKAHLISRNATYDDGVSSKNLMGHFQKLLLISRQLQLFSKEETPL